MKLPEQLKDTFLKEKDPFKDIVGQGDAKAQIKSALLMGRHIIISGPPGVGKTTTAKNIAKLLPAIQVNTCPYHCSPDNPLCPECKLAGGKAGKKRIEGIERFVRIQGSPDLTVEDLLGDIDPVKALKFGPLSIEAFTPGKIFRANEGVLFFDEVNRCPEKLQNAMLQVLQEGIATIGSYDVDLPADFIFIGTMNPEDVSTERLSEVFLDRFDVIYMGYPESIDLEKQIVKLRGKQAADFPEKLFHFAIGFVRSLRVDPNVEKKPSVRASLGLYERAQSNAYLKGRKKVSYDDIREAVISVLSHRIELKPSVKYLESPEKYIEQEFRKFSSDSREMDEKTKGGGP
ncbi:AAA domain-containing protein [Candidatus Woesearchaeota archaeon]|nr:AAA domain-containing protein [Candidatus Woesearchaeota archaeon]